MSQSYNTSHPPINCVGVGVGSTAFSNKPVEASLVPSKGSCNCRVLTHNRTANHEPRAAKHKVCQVAHALLVTQRRYHDGRALRQLSLTHDTHAPAFPTNSQSLRPPPQPSRLLVSTYAPTTLRSYVNPTAPTARPIACQHTRLFVAASESKLDLL
jgi:hypothetical protein